MRAVRPDRRSPRRGECAVAPRVAAARERQRARFQRLGFATCAPIPKPTAIFWSRSPGPNRRLKLLHQAAEQMHLSARGFHRVLKVARTLADLAGREPVTRIDIAEALSYRHVGSG